MPRNNWTPSLGYMPDALHLPSKSPVCLLSCLQPGKLTYWGQIKGLLHLLVLTGFSQWGAQTGIGRREEVSGPELPGCPYPAGHPKGGLLYRTLFLGSGHSSFLSSPWSRGSNSSSGLYTMACVSPTHSYLFK